MIQLEHYCMYVCAYALTDRRRLIWCGEREMGEIGLHILLDCVAYLWPVRLFLLPLLIVADSFFSVLSSLRSVVSVSVLLLLLLLTPRAPLLPPPPPRLKPRLPVDVAAVGVAAAVAGVTGGSSLTRQ